MAVILSPFMTEGDLEDVWAYPCLDTGCGHWDCKLAREVRWLREGAGDGRTFVSVVKGVEEA